MKHLLLALALCSYIGTTYTAYPRLQPNQNNYSINNTPTPENDSYVQVAYTQRTYISESPAQPTLNTENKNRNTIPINCRTALILGIWISGCVASFKLGNALMFAYQCP